MNELKNAAATATTTAEQQNVTKNDLSEKTEASNKKKKRDKVEDIMIQHTNVLFKRVKPTLEEGEYTTKLRKCFDMAVQQKYVTRGKSVPDALNEISRRVYYYMSNYHFLLWCKKFNYSPFAAATHAVLLGKTVMKRALMDDVMQFAEPKFSDSQLWKEPVFKEEELTQYQSMVEMSGLPEIEEIPPKTNSEELGMETDEQPTQAA